MRINSLIFGVSFLLLFTLSRSSKTAETDEPVKLSESDTDLPHTDPQPKPKPKSEADAIPSADSNMPKDLIGEQKKEPSVEQSEPPLAAVDEAPKDDGPLAEIVPLPPSKRSQTQLKTPSLIAATTSETKTEAKTIQSLASPGPASRSVLREPGYNLVLSGTLEHDLQLGPSQSPVLIRGSFVVPAGITLQAKAGTVIHLRADPHGEKPAQAGTPDSTQSAMFLVWGSLQFEGVTGNPVEFSNLEKEDASLLLYGAAQSKLDGTRIKGVAITQSAGVCLWTNCELFKVSHYSLAAGAALFTQCSFRECGGFFATYSLGPWSLLMRKNLFEGCREGVILGSDPGESRLIVEKNSFVKTRGACLRAMSAPGVKNSKIGVEMLIGENWYGTAVPEEIDMRIVDHRNDPALRARLNTRPPAEQPYENIGAGVPMSVLAATLREQLTVQQTLLRAHQNKLVGAWIKQSEPAKQTARQNVLR